MPPLPGAAGLKNLLLWLILRFWHLVDDVYRWWIILCLKTRDRRSRLPIFLLKCRYRLCLRRKSLILFVRRCLIRLNLFSRERKLVAKYGSRWRLCVLDNEVVELLELVKHTHGVIQLLISI